MTTRVTQDEVRAITGYAATDDASQFIKVANLVVDEKLFGHGLSDSMLTQIELFLAAHFMELSKTPGPLQMRVIGQAHERYHDIYASGLRATRFGAQAIMLDTTGILGKLANSAEKPMLRALFTTVGDPRANVDPLTLMDLP